MQYIAGGEAFLGSERFYPEEAPLRKVRLDPFWIDITPVTNAQFAAFVAATGYVTFAEHAPDPALYPGMSPDMAQPGSLVFVPSTGPVRLDLVQWWEFRFGACWHKPLGDGSSLDQLGDHPVVHIAYADAKAYAAWAGKSLPSEAEWEYAARGGLVGKEFAWGDELAPDGEILANYWQGPFPQVEAATGTCKRTSAVGSYPANGYGLYDMIGNTWEWTDDWFSMFKRPRKRLRGCCLVNPRGGSQDGSREPGSPQAFPRKVLKGGSHLCAQEYCQRYRPAARYPQPIDTTTSHVGFRCVVRGGSRD